MVVQVPDFADSFWVYQIVDLGSDSFAARHDVWNDALLLLVGPN